MMSDNNDFLKGYKDGEQSPSEPEPKPGKEPGEPKEPGGGMSFKEKETFRRSEPQYPSRNYYPSNRGGGGMPPKTKNTIAIALTVFSVLLIIIMVVVLTANKITVPNFAGWQRNDFMLWAGENSLMTQIEEKYSDNVEKEIIISQSVAEGTKIKKGDIIKVAVSIGPDMSVELDLPDLMHMTNSQIEQWADENRMSKVRITGEYSATVPLGYVIEYEINDATVVDKVKRDTPIYIVVSKGPESEQSVDVVVPDFKTMGVSESVIFAQENGLNLTIENQYDDYTPANSIISQSVKKDEVLHPGDSVKIIVSLGKKLLMIDFGAFSKEEAASKASQLGVSYTITERYSSSKKGRLIWQSIDEGTKIEPDMHLELRFSLGSKIFIDNYVGMKKSAIEKWLEEENLLGARATLNFTYTQNAADPGTILQQSVADTYIYRDKTINVVVSSGAILYAPDFVSPLGATYEDAITREKALQMADGMDITLVFVQENNTARLAGEVWYQSIAAGTEIAAGTTITLKYNPPGVTVVVPDFTNLTQTQVQALPEYSKLNVTFVEGDYDINYAGKVYSQSIAKLTTVAQGTEITLYVSPEVIMVTVPDFDGMTQEEVESSPQYGNFVITFITGFSGDPADAGKVHDQDVPAYSYVAKGTAITLTLGTTS